MSEKLCLQWNDFKDNLCTAFGSFRGEVDFTDVTLVSEDGEQVEAHKVILAASSPFFRDLLKKKKPAHPLIYLRGVKSEELAAIIAFLYNGEANIFQENLDSFLALADQFQLKGLTGQKSELIEKDQKPNPFQAISSFEEEAKSRSKAGGRQRQIAKYEVDEKIVALTNDAIGNIQELDERVRSMMEKTDIKTSDGARKMYVCKVCGKEGQSINIQQHIEAQHLERVSIPCDLCEKMFRSRNTLSVHTRQHHRE